MLLPQVPKLAFVACINVMPAANIRFLLYSIIHLFITCFPILLYAATLGSLQRSKPASVAGVK